MTTLDGDWLCDQDCDECFAIWDHCENCGKVKCADAINGGLVPKGQGIPIADERGNLWYELRGRLAANYDICPECMGSGGGYICGFHDDAESPAPHSGRSEVL